VTSRDAIERARRAIEEIKAGKMVILVDDEDRENEGDITMASAMVTPEAITFMATKACGLICVTLSPERVEKLQLPMMVEENRAPLGTAFTISIEASKGVSTGISAADRARTIKVAADPNTGKEDLVSPGHVFPLRAMPGGVLQRTGQTEGSVDLARLAGLEPSGVICEIMKDDGTMARMPDLEIFAKEHKLVIVSIADLIEYRLQRDSLVTRVSTTPLELFGSSGTSAVFDAHIYRAVPGVRRRECVALTLGEVSNGDPVPCRAHLASLSDDVFGAKTRQNSPALEEVIDAIIRNQRGVILYLPSRNSIETELTKVDEPSGSPRPRDVEGEIREYGIGAQILLDLGIHKLQVISNNPHKLVGLEAWGFESVEQIPLQEV
jgi:3,4-dihydroxy 2-butanone 4-phosphate synthase / GTP cyclohydrolase II